MIDKTHWLRQDLSVNLSKVYGWLRTDTDTGVEAWLRKDVTLVDIAKSVTGVDIRWVGAVVAAIALLYLIKK